jgi:hypothetical protein
MTFFQTLALLLAVKLKWPPELKALMLKVKALSMQSQLGRDCFTSAAK